MSKKSAKSKGYRSYKKEKPFLTRKEIYFLIAIVALVVVGVIISLIYDDGALKVKNGVLQGVEDRWIVANGGTVSTPRYFKLGEVGELDGYTHLNMLSASDTLITDNYYYPAQAENPIDYISISTGSIKNSTPADLGKTVVEAVRATDGYTVTSDLTEARVGDIAYTYYAFTNETYVAPEGTDTTENTEAADGEQAPNTFGQSMNAYVAAAHDNCLMIHVVNEVETPEDYLSDDELRATLETVISAITLEN